MRGLGYLITLIGRAKKGLHALGIGTGGGPNLRVYFYNIASA